MKWDEETDVLVIGYGGAGATAAITAHDSGAKVFLVEKMDKGGGNTNVSFGGFLCLNDLAAGLDYLKNLCFRVSPGVDLETIETFAVECFRNRQWLESLGARTHVYGGAAFPQLPGAEAMEKRVIIGPNTKEENSFWNFMRHQVESRQIATWYQSPVKELVTDSGGSLSGALVAKEGMEKRVRTRRAIILTCGGFEFDDWLKTNYLKEHPYYALGSPGNTGDGIRLAQKMGADLWHMSAVATPLGFKAPEFAAAFLIKPVADGFIFVDQEGKRFASELVDIHAYNFLVDFFDIHTLRFPRIPCFLIFDEATRRAGPLAVNAMGYNRGRYTWSKDNGKEIRRGWIVADDTIAGLARKIGLDQVNLKKSISRYNKACELGEDREFKRPKDKLVPLGPGPYYALKLWPCLLNTQGGPRRNAKAQVLYPDGQPVPRLYSAGELGSIFGFLYQGAGNIGECLVFGRIAGKEAAATKPLS